MGLASCSRKTGTAGRSATLRDRARILENEVEWSDETALAENSQPPKLSVSPALAQDTLAHIAAFSFSASSRNYPVLEGFASLDTSSYSDASFSVLDGFCHALEEGKGEDSYMDKGFLYSLALFRYGLESQGKGKYKPVSHIIGKPLLPDERKKEKRDNSLQCPVRFIYKDKSFCDVYVYLVKSVSDWKVDQIEFIKEELEEGS